MTDKLVFVTIKDGPTLPSGRPLRRAVVPVNGTTSWESFEALVKKKLRVAHVGSFYSKAGRQVRTIAEALDVDDLEVEEVRAAGAIAVPHATGTNGQGIQAVPDGVKTPQVSVRIDNATPSMQASIGTPLSGRRLRPSAGQSLSFQNGHALNGEASTSRYAASPSVYDDADKYGPKGSAQNGISAYFQRMGRAAGLGGWSSPSQALPVTMGDAKGGGDGAAQGGTGRSRRRANPGSKHKPQRVRLGHVLVGVSFVLCFATMIMLYTRLQPGLANEEIDV